MEFIQQTRTFRRRFAGNNPNKGEVPTYVHGAD